MNTVHTFVQGSVSATVSLGGVETPSLKGLVATFNQNRSILGKAALADLEADLAHPEGQLAFVANDSASSKNGFYLKLGASGSGSWSKSDDTVFSDAAMADRTLYYDKTILTHIGYVDDTGTINNVSNESYGIGYSDKLPVTTFTMRIIVNFTAQSISHATFYDITGAVLAVTTGFTQGVFKDVAVPVGADTVRFCGARAGVNPAQYFYAETRLKDDVPFIESRLKEIDFLSLNEGKTFPFRRMTRSGFTSLVSPYMLSAFRNIRIHGAEPGKYYRLAYFKNGNVVLSQNVEGIILEEFDASTYATAAPDSAPRIINYAQALDQIPRDGEVHTLHAASDASSGVSIDMDIDTAALPAYGTPISMLTSMLRGWSWIIDPSCYVYRMESAVTSLPLKCSLASTGVVSIAFQSGSKLYRINFGPNGKNSLPNIIGEDESAFDGSWSGAAFASIYTGATDWLPPLAFAAAENGDGQRLIYTGGNHGSDGSGGGENTARNMLYQIYADGQILTPPASGTVPFSADRVSFLIVNELFASNTISLNRYAVRQTFFVDVHPGGIEARCEVLPYEDVVIFRDNGPQSVTNGFQSTMLYLGGQYSARASFDSDSDSGAKTSCPDAWAVVFQGPSNRQQTLWMDRSYGVGDGRYVDSSRPFIRGGGPNNHKFYNAAVSSAEGVQLQAGEKYVWRGGWSWQEAQDFGAALDSTFTFWRGGQMCQTAIVAPDDYAVLPTA